MSMSLCLQPAARPLLCFLFLCAAIAPAQSVRVSPTDLTALDAHHLKIEATEYLGRKAVKLTTASQADESGYAVLAGTDFQDGTIEAEMAVKITTPPGVRMPGFAGVAFRMNPEGSEYELFYLRPRNALAEDQAMRNHAVQYCAEPNYDWYRLRREWPFIYESYADIGPETWIKLKIEVTGRTARLFLNGSANPSLVVDGLKSSNLRGRVAFWGYAGEETYFSNVRVTPSPAAPIKNGSDASGRWEVKSTTDTGPFTGTLKLMRNGGELSGSWSGELGNDEPVTGTWRDGYIEISFPAEWPADRDGKPGPTTAHLDGWIDDAAAKGRIRLEGRTVGMWAAERKAE
jgi:hypothetical protein